MSNSLAMILLGVALLVTAGLAGYAFLLWREVGKRKAFRYDEDRRAVQNSLENLELVASALLQDQVGITEAAWRCRTLFDIIESGLVDEPEFKAFAIVHARTQHLHSHSARMALTAAQRRKEDQERLEVEGEMREPVLASAKAALDFVAKKRRP
ncbi:DUF2489 domain-containing protein [Halomonas halocynthiae]|uniref:DUF2489 domain-containing protein n=1 Tax=Halomonas halocynthiae TaxID=176290 RepID=UPI00041AD1CE|nr:DUF2489 domain-containing protein [Halomonas halocynthiae]